jgi:N-acetylmuramoyl-L-alanine amidase
MNRKIKWLVVHCTASPQTQKVSAILNYWKTEFGWEQPGYHVLIEADGTAHELLPIDQVANGVKGFNSKSIHISYIGGVDKDGKPTDNRTDAQKETMLRYLKKWKKMFPDAIIQGHRDFSLDKNKNGIIDPWERIKECPSFHAKIEYASPRFDAIREFEEVE